MVEEEWVETPDDLKYEPWFGDKQSVNHDFGDLIFGDYEILNPEENVYEAGKAFAEDMLAKLLPAFPFITAFAIFWVNDDSRDECVGLYANGTTTAPVFSLNHDTLFNYFCDCGTEALVRETAMTLAHEFAHAVQECCGDEDMCEDEAEAFARAFVNDGKIIPIAGTEPVL